MQQFPYIAEIFVLGGIASAAVIAVDLRSCRQPMRIMHSVWILTGLWAGFFGLWAYFAFGRTKRCKLAEKAVAENGQHPAGQPGTERPDPPATDTTGGMEMRTGHRALHETDMHHPYDNTMPGMSMHPAESASASTEMPSMQMPAGDGATFGTNRPADSETSGTKMPGMHMPAGDGATAGMEMSDMQMPGMEMPARPKWQSVVLSTLHCGAGCTLADLVGEWFLYFVPIAIGGSLIAGSWVVDYLLALVFGIGFQYAAIRAMEPRTPRTQIVRRAAKADILSLTAWQAGMYGWMAVVIFALHDGATMPRTSFAFWFMMQIAMACGFLVALPVNVWLIRRGIKKGM